MSSRAWLRVALLCLPPLLLLALRPGSAPLALALGGGLVALLLELLRQRKRCLPFPVYLLLVYAMQASAALALPGQLGGLPGVATSVVEEGAAAPSGSGGTVGAVAAAPHIQTMAVVIAAHNEHKYMKRTLDSIYASTPPEVLKEIIVVDDASTPPLAGSLRAFPKVRVLRHEDRRGLIKSKTEGGNLASADMIMFLDGHVKPEQNWWRPILRHMNINYRRVVVPVIPILNADTWQPNLHAVGVKMMFDWTLFFQWFEDHNDLVPCMSGGLFGITRQWWHESGEYDYGMMMWGAENIEQSIRVWLCGGEIYVARDSLVSHVFRSSFPYKINNTEIYINKVRTVETWFDEYKENYYRADPAARQFVKHLGDISERLALKQRLQCKPFRWYVEKFRQVFADKQMLPEEVLLFRDRRTSRCLQLTPDHAGLQEAACNPDARMQQWARVVKAGDAGSFRNLAANKCLDANANLADRDGADVLLYPCMAASEMQVWELQAGRLSWQRRFCIQGSREGRLKLAQCSKFLQPTGDFEIYAPHSVTGPGAL